MKPPPKPTVPAARRSIAVRVLRAAIERYHIAVKRHKRIDAAAGGGLPGVCIDSSLSRWTTLAWQEQADAERFLLRALIAWGQSEMTDVGTWSAEKKRWPASGVIFQGKTYLAVPHGDNDSEEGEGDDTGRADAMTLVIMDRSKVQGIDVEAIEA